MAKSRVVTSAKSWKKRNGIELTLPSGNICLVKRPGMEKILRAGIMPDSLTPIIQEELAKAESGGRPAKASDADDMAIAAKMLENENTLADMMTSFDKVTALCVVEPKVLYHIYTGSDVLPDGYDVGDDIPDDERDDEVIYTDDVDFEDKVFIFNYVVGGSSDLERFRKEYGAGLEDLADQSGDEVSA